jgi:hypothetical protein
MILVCLFFENEQFSVFLLAASGKNTEKSNQIRALSRDLLKKRNLLLTLLVSLIEASTKFL